MNHYMTNNLYRSCYIIILLLIHLGGNSQNLNFEEKINAWIGQSELEGSSFGFSFRTLDGKETIAAYNADQSLAPGELF